MKGFVKVGNTVINKGVIDYIGCVSKRTPIDIKDMYRDGIIHPNDSLDSEDAQFWCELHNAEYAGCYSPRVLKAKTPEEIEKIEEEDEYNEYFMLWCIEAHVGRKVFRYGKFYTEKEAYDALQTILKEAE